VAPRSQGAVTRTTADAPCTRRPAEAREAFDVTGAGDTVVAAIARARAAGAVMVDAATLANICAGSVVGKMGTAACYAADLSASIHHQSLSEAESKVLGVDQLLTKVRHWQSSGKKVAFTNGCFDLLHPGHISLLKQSRKACDCLIVGLNSDTSIRDLKGEGRPIQNEIARATIIASLADVAAVVLFSESTPLKLIKALKPDVLIKGADYSVEQVVGADVVQGYGGKVILADLKDGHSTTNTISRMGK